MQPHRTRYVFVQALLVATILIATFLLTAVAVGQTTPTQLPADCSAYASIPLPAEADKVPLPKTSPTCASYRSYRGISRPVNYAEARACAWQERLAQKAELGYNAREPLAWVVGGSLILADIYANGAGVKRNIPLAMRFTCEFDDQGAKRAVQGLAKLNTPTPPHHRFELCDYAATTFTMNFCSAYESEIEEDRRSRYYNSLKSSMNSQQQAAFEKLVAAQKAYLEAHASEVDQGGTIRNLRTMGSQNILKTLFHSELVHFEHKRWPTLSEKQITAADAMLQREYDETLEQLRTRPKEETYQGAVTPECVTSAEEKWQAYRDAWVEFARLRYPAEVAGIRAEITLNRYRLLKTIR